MWPCWAKSNPSLYKSLPTCLFLQNANYKLQLAITAMSDQHANFYTRPWMSMLQLATVNRTLMWLCLDPAAIISGCTLIAISHAQNGMLFDSSEWHWFVKHVSSMNQLDHNEFHWSFTYWLSSPEHPCALWQQNGHYQSHHTRANFLEMECIATCVSNKWRSSKCEKDRVWTNTIF